MFRSDVLVLLGYIGFAISWLLALYYMIRAAMSRSPDAPFRWLVATNPLNVLFYPDDLTEAGRTYRRRFLLSILAAAISFLVIWLASPRVHS